MKHLFRTGMLAFLICAATTISAQRTFKSPIELNDYFASINDTLYQGGKDWGTKLSSVMNSKSYDSLIPYRTKLERYIAKKTVELTKMKDYKGSTDFQNAMLGFLAFESRMIKEAFVPIDQLKKTSTEEEIKKAIDNLFTISGQEDEELKKVHAAQNDYAKKNGFTIEQ